MDFYFEKIDQESKYPYERAIVHISIDPDFPILKFDVDLDSLPDFDGNSAGYEVVANFHIESFNNNETFYTDSNGLEMQKRILNYRPSWDFSTQWDETNENVTANYYPITSAI